MMARKIWQRVKPWCVPIGLTLFAYVILRCVLLIGYVPSASMEPTLPEGSIIVGLRIFSKPKVGDIIIFERDGILMVKRVAAVGGDEIDLTNLTYMDSVPIPIRDAVVLTVPENSYFVLGDNSQNSFDSRYWDYPFVSYEDVAALCLSGSSLRN